MFLRPQLLVRQTIARLVQGLGWAYPLLQAPGGKNAGNSQQLTYLLAFLMAMRLSLPFGSNSPVLTEKIFCRIEKRRTCGQRTIHDVRKRPSQVEYSDVRQNKRAAQLPQGDFSKHLLCGLLDFRVGLGEERQKALATELLALACVNHSGGRGA